MDRYVNFSPVIFNGATNNEVDGAVYKKRSRVERSPSALSDGASGARAAHTDLSDSSVNNQTADATKKEASSKWHSVWDLRPDKEKTKKRKQHKQKLKQGLKDLMNIGDPAMGGQDSVTISDLVTSQPEPIVKREKPKRPPPPIIMSEIKDNYGTPDFDDSTALTSLSAPPSARIAPRSARPTPEIATITPEPIQRFTKNTSTAASRVPKSIPEIPKLPKGKKMLETVVSKDVDSLFRSIFENETFFEIVTKKTYDEVRNFGVTEWTTKSDGERRRKMAYEFPKTIAFSRHEIRIEQVQTQAAYSHQGRVYAVDCVTQNSGVMYSDYFEIHIHYRLTAEEENKSRLVVIGDIVFVKPCLFKGRIETESWSGLKKYYEMMEREVQLERKPDRETTNSPDAIDNTGAQVPTSRRSGSGNKVRTADSGLTKTSPELERKSDSSLVLGEQTLSFAFLLVILTLMIITLALFKLASAIATLSERLGTIEELLERYALICLDPAMKYHGEESVS